MIGRSTYNELNAYSTHNGGNNFGNGYHHQMVTNSSTNNVAGGVSHTHSSSPTDSSLISNPDGLSFFYGDSNATGTSKKQMTSFPGQQTTMARQGNAWHHPHHNSSFMGKDSDNYYKTGDPAMGVWMDPNPKKKIHPDNGTAIWGDPTRQGTIKKWKHNDDVPVIMPPLKTNKDVAKVENGATSATVSVSSTVGGGDQQQQRENGTTSRGSTALWDDERSTPTPQHNTSIVSGSSWLNGSGNEKGTVPKPMGWDFGVGVTKTTEEVTYTGFDETKYSSNRSTPFMGAEQRQTTFPTESMNLNGLGNNGMEPKFGNHNAMQNSDYLSRTSSNAFSLNSTVLASLAARNRPPSRPSTAEIQNRIADQIRHAVQIGLLDPQILREAPNVASKEQLELLNQCLFQMQRVERLRRDYYQKYPDLGGGSHQQQNDFKLIQEYDRQLKFMTNEFLSSVRIAISNSSNGGSVSQDDTFMSNGRESKLDHWKRGIALPSVEGAVFPESGLSAYAITSNSTWSHNANVNDSGSDWPTMPNMSKKSNQKIDSTKDILDDPSVEATMNAVVDDITHEPTEKLPVPAVQRTSTPIEDQKTTGIQNVRSTTTSTSAAAARTNLTTPTLPTLDADVPEFKPGQLWMWRDPKELAADPEATPGSISSKKSSMTAPDTNGFLGSYAAAVAGSDTGIVGNMNGLSINDYNNVVVNGDANTKFAQNGYLPSTTRPSSAWMKAAQQAQLQQQQHEIWTSIPVSVGPQYVGPSANMRPQALPYAQLVPGMPISATRASVVPQEPWMPMTNGYQQTGSRASPMHFAHSHHSMPGIPVGPQQRGVPYASIKPGAPASTPAASPTPYMVPYSKSMGGSTHWVVLSNFRMDEPSLQAMLSRFAPIASCIFPPGAGFACFKFKESVLEKILPRLNSECSSLGMSVQIAKDDEIALLIQSAQGAPPQAFY